MSSTVEVKKAIKGGQWLTTASLPEDCFIPEDFTEEQRMIKDMCTQFLDTEVFPIVQRIDAMEPGLMPSLVAKTGELGLLSVSIPEAYGGLAKVST